MDISQLALSVPAGAVVKGLVDAIKWYWPTGPWWAYLALAGVLSPPVYWAWLVLTPGTPRPIVYDETVVAVLLIGSILTITTAVGVTELAKAATARRAEATAPPHARDTVRGG